MVTKIEAYGPAVTKDHSGYRILINYLQVFRIIRKVKPEVLEAGDPWLTGIFCLALKKSGIFKGKLVSFYHSDPIPSYLEPWTKIGRFRGVKKILAALAGWLFYKLQNGYDLTAVSSRAMEAHLHAKGIQTVVYLPFGVPSLYLTELPKRSQGQIRVLYAGRLDREKGMDLLLAIMPDLLTHENVEISVMGRGGYAGRFAAWVHPRFSYLGFLESPEQVRDVYDRHDILLAPGPYETFGLGVLEAMARGMLVVGPDVGGTGELLRQAESPYIFKAHDREDFLRTVRLALASDHVHGVLQARALAERYGTWDDAVGRMVECYAQPEVAQ